VPPLIRVEVDVYAELGDVADGPEPARLGHVVAADAVEVAGELEELEPPELAAGAEEEVEPAVGAVGVAPHLRAAGERVEPGERPHQVPLVQEVVPAEAGADEVVLLEPPHVVDLEAVGVDEEPAAGGEVPLHLVEPDVERVAAVGAGGRGGVEVVAYRAGQRALEEELLVGAEAEVPVGPGGEGADADARAVGAVGRLERRHGAA